MQINAPSNDRTDVLKLSTLLFGMAGLIVLAHLAG